MPQYASTDPNFGLGDNSKYVSTDPNFGVDQQAAQPEEGFFAKVKRLAQAPSPEWMQPAEKFLKTPLISAAPIEKGLQAIGSIGAMSPEDLQPSPIEQGITRGEAQLI